jgi:4-amino-4-deoxy-L-arabinose transferase-like glycosyltransferase
MTSITEPRLAPGTRSTTGLPRTGWLARRLAWSLIRGAESEAAWVRPAFLGVLALSAVLYVWNLTVSGYANVYYSAAAVAASHSWSAWFFGSIDANNFITVDKPPLSTMLMGLSVRVFGLSSWSILLPEALCGVATVGFLFAAVKRSFGPVAALIAAVVLALTPAAVLIFRFNNPDALLTLLLVVAAWALLRSVENGSFRWMFLAAGLVGLAFLTKYLQAYLVLPAFALVFGFSAHTTLRRRLAGLVMALATVLVASGWWVAVMELLPAGSKPFVGGSTTGSALDLIFGYDGLGRIFGAGGPGGGGGPGFGGVVSPFRLFNDQFYGEIAWLIPLAVVCLVYGLARRHSVARTDMGLAGYLLWGGWFVVTAVVFSYMSGIVHSYYAVALAPAIGALVGAGLTDLWRARLPFARARLWLGGAAVGVAALGTAWFGSTLLDRMPSFYPGLGTTAIVLAGVALTALLVLSAPRLARVVAARRLAVAVAALGIAAMLAAPAAYSLETMNNAYGGGDPHPGPGTPTSFGFGGMNFPGGGNFGAGPGGGNPGGNPDGSVAGSDDATLYAYLVANRGNAKWIVAANSAQEAGSIELATGLPVMAMGGFTGSDPAPTVDQLKAYVASGELRFVLVNSMGGAFGGFGPGFGDTNRTGWVMSNCKVVSEPGISASLYDCAGAA